MTAIDWQSYTRLFTQAVTSLGIDVSYVRSSESVNRLQFSIDRFNGQPLIQYKPAQVETILKTFVDLFGAALTLRFILGSKTILQTTSSIEDINEFLIKIRDGIEPRLDFNLDKYTLIKNLLLVKDYPNIVVKLFFFPEALQRALSIPLTRLEAQNELWYEMDDRHRLIVIVPDREISLSGNHLTLLGGNALGQLYDHLDAPEASSVELIRRMRELALDSLSPVKWIYFKLRFLTPLHLHVEGEIQTDDVIAEALYTQLMSLCLIYCADRTKGPAEEDIDNEGATAKWSATFSEQGHIFDVTWDGTTKIPVTDNRFENSLIWSKVVSFAYSDAIYCFDRLKIIQLTVAHTLSDKQTALGYNDISSRAGKIQEYAYASWGNFIEGKIKEYFSQLSDLESAVDTATEKFQEQVDKLTHTVFENALTAVGVLIGTFIAAAFQDKFNLWIFWIGVISYILYTLIFPYSLGLEYAQKRFNDTVSAFEKRCNAFKSRLNDTIVNGIVGSILDDWKDNFNTWFGRAKSVYRGITILLLIIAVAVTLVTWGGIGSQKPIVTGTPSPAPTQSISETNTPFSPTSPNYP